MTKLTRSEILAIAEDDEKLDKYSSFDAQVLIGLADTLKKTPPEFLNPSAERERLYDRELGKANQPNSVDVNIRVQLASRLEDAFKEIDASTGLVIENAPVPVIESAVGSVIDSQAVQVIALKPETK